MKKIAFIGAGNMAQSIIGGMIAGGTPKGSIWATARTTSTRQKLAEVFGINVVADNHQAVQSADIIVLSVKPNMMADLCLDIAADIQGKLVISVAAGIGCNAFEKWLGNDTAIIRCMPNTPSLVGEGACGLYANKNVSDNEKNDAVQIMASTGTALWVEDETLMHAVTAVSGSAPAYFFLFLDAMTKAGVEQGLDAATAKSLAIQTAKGAAILAEQSEDDLETLRKKVTSPGGTTEQAILHFQTRDLSQIVGEAMEACANHSKKMAEKLQ